MCDCLDPGIPGDIGISPILPCEMITIDLLATYLAPVSCYIQYKLWSKIQSSEKELQAAERILKAFITEKESNPSFCIDEAQFVLVQNIVHRIINSGLCL